MKLFNSPKAPNPDRVDFFLRAKGKFDAVETQSVNIIAQEHKTEDYRAISPFAQVPVLQLDDGTCITESRAICTYFEGLYPEPNLMGSDPKEKALIEMWDRRVEFLMLLQFANWFRNSHPAMAELEKPQLPEAAAKGERNAKAAVQRFNDHLAYHDFMAADRFSIADITLYIACRFGRIMKWTPEKELEHLGNWYARVDEMGLTG